MKRQILSSLLLCLFSTSSLFAATQVPANLSGDVLWDKVGSPYLLQGKVVVPSGATLKVSAGVQVIFQGASTLEVDGKLEVAGSAAAPAVFNMIEGGMQSELLLNGGEARIGNAKILSGVFLAVNEKLSMQGVEVTKGSGLYLQGSTTASLKSNKIYGNAAGIILDGPIKASIQFNTLVQNTYGLQIKSVSSLTFKNNSVHGNQVEVVNGSSSLDLGGNYWGTSDSKALKSLVQGPVETAPMRSLKDVLRAYIHTQLPTITAKMSNDLAAREAREKKESALALKKLRKAKESPAVVKTSPSEEPAASTAPSEIPSPAEEAKAAQTTPVEEAPVQTLQEAPATKTGQVTPLKSAPRALKPLALPEDQGDVASMPAAPLPEGSAAEISVPETPASPASPAAAAVPDTSVTPPGMDDLPIPDLDSASASPAAPAADTPAPPSAPPVTASTDTLEAIPAPPGESNSAAAAPPVANNSAAASAFPEPPVPPATPLTPPTEEEKNAADNVAKGVGGDIDGMQAPPLDLFGDLSNVPLDDKTTGAVKPKKEEDIVLPPLQDTEVAPPKDLDLPPTDDLGNIDLNSKQ